MDYKKILEVLRKNVRNSFGEIFDQQLLESAVFAVEVESKGYEQENQKLYKKILLNYLDNLYSSLSILNTNFLKKKIIHKLNEISREKRISDILIIPGDFDFEITEEISLFSEIEKLENKIENFLNSIKEIRSYIDNSPGPEPPRNKNRGPRGPGGL